MTLNIYDRVQEILKLRNRYFELVLLSHTVPFSDPKYDEIIHEKSTVSKQLNDLGFTDQGLDVNASMINILVYAYEHPNAPFTHRLFEPNEYLYYDPDTTYIKDEDGNVFETWVEGQGYNGMIQRGYDDRYDMGWRTYNQE